MIAFIFALGWFFTSLMYAYQGWRTGQLQAEVWDLESCLAQLSRDNEELMRQIAQANLRSR